MGKKEIADNVIREMLPQILRFQGKHKFLCTNDKPTWVDFYFFEEINVMRWATDGKIFDDYPNLKYYYKDM